MAKMGGAFASLIPFKSVKVFLPLCGFVVALAVNGPSSPAQAADTNGKFAIKGAGLQTCEGFLKATKEQTRDVMLYAGWIDGYITGQNQFVSGLYDLASWKNTQTLLSLTQAVCKKEPPATQFMSAFDQVLRAILPYGLTAESAVSGLASGDKKAFIYTEILVRMQIALTEKGFETKRQDGIIDQNTSDALRAFQSENDIALTGLPDQETLFNLFLR